MSRYKFTVTKLWYITNYRI